MTEQMIAGSRIAALAAAAALMSKLPDGEDVEQMRKVRAEHDLHLRNELRPVYYRPARNGSKTYKPNGARECARRARQLEKIASRSAGISP